MKTLTPDGLEWIKYASIDMNIRVFNNKINDILDKSYPLLLFVIILIYSPKINNFISRKIFFIFQST